MHRTRANRTVNRTMPAPRVVTGTPSSLHIVRTGENETTMVSIQEEDTLSILSQDDLDMYLNGPMEQPTPEPEPDTVNMTWEEAMGEVREEGPGMSSPTPADVAPADYRQVECMAASVTSQESAGGTYYLDQATSLWPNLKVTVPVTPPPNPVRTQHDPLRDGRQGNQQRTTAKSVPSRAYRRRERQRRLRERLLQGERPERS